MNESTNGDLEDIESFISPVSTSSNSESDPDPLELRKLALSFDYLIYKIKDHISSLAESTYNSIILKQNLINQDYFNDQLQLSTKYNEIDDILTKCNQLELEFLKLDQLQMFINEFKQRLTILEREFKKLN